ncbi:hypothetical protein NP233_g8720 [Leucocoprinus birnbaumii]|uniref:Uncharacterized protein n=1 Tax=Leucocoprinus birnbaumii TaxID=56174 RepID=A0AAD5VSA8_9AGAR|nr:hypothetical protein NP233_g8720 [Leucocoprinus birnbaumii]
MASGNFVSEIQELNLYFIDFVHIEDRVTTCCRIVGSFLKSFGGNVRRLNLHIMRSGVSYRALSRLETQSLIRNAEIHSGSLIPSNDLQSLIHLESLEIILHVDNNEEMDICPFPQTWLCPFLKSLPSARCIPHLLIIYQLYIPEPRITRFETYNTPLLLTLWEGLDNALRTWSALRRLEFYLDLYRRDTCEDARSERESGTAFGQSQIFPIFRNLAENREVETIAMFSDPETRGENDG